VSHHLRPPGSDRSAARTEIVDSTVEAAAVDEAMRDAATVEFDIVDKWGEHSFPASDPPANW
jgi:hypothetical protein